MITALVSIALCAALFGLAAWLRPKPGCGGNCGMCKHACALTEQGHDHV